MWPDKDRGSYSSWSHTNDEGILIVCEKCDSDTYSFVTVAKKQNLRELTEEEKLQKKVDDFIKVLCS